MKKQFIKTWGEKDNRGFVLKKLYEFNFDNAIMKFGTGDFGKTLFISSKCVVKFIWTGSRGKIKEWRKTQHYYTIKERFISAFEEFNLLIPRYVKLVRKGTITREEEVLEIIFMKKEELY